jgi:hypothetical protein
MLKKRTRLSEMEAIALGLALKKRKENSLGNERYFLTKEQIDQLQKLRDFHSTEFKEVRRTLNDSGKVISTVEKLGQKKLIDIPSNHEIKRVSTNVTNGQQWIITEPIKEQIVDPEQIDFTKFFEGKITPVDIKPKAINQKALFDRAVLTDVHVGMKVSDGHSLYDGSWDEEELFKRRDIFVNEIINNQKSNKLLIHELGDFMDGYNGMTTRGGHELPQNMDNQKAFDVALSFKITLIDALFQYYSKIEIVNICNDNHAGAFGYIVNSAFKSYIELKYKNVSVINQRKFIDHYIFDNRCFILTHGKDDKSLKFGFKPHLDAVQIEKIKNYIDEYKLHCYQIEFSKGDSHQLLFDLTSSTAFEYQNFGAFSPPSDWVKVNFKNTKSSFTTMNYYEKQKTINNYIF